MSITRKKATGYKWHNTRKKWFKANRGPYTCCRCKLPIAEHETVSLDHIASWAEYPEYRYELSNLRPAHVFCNQEAANKQLLMLRKRGVIGIKSK